MDFLFDKVCSIKCSEVWAFPILIYFISYFKLKTLTTLVLTYPTIWSFEFYFTRNLLNYWYGPLISLEHLPKFVLQRIYYTEIQNELLNEKIS